MKQFHGYAMILGAALFWGASATWAKMLLNRRLDTVLVVQSRVTISFLLMLAFYAAFKPALLRIDTRDLWKFGLLGIIGIAGSNFTYYFTIKESTVATGILIQYTAPLLVMAYAAFTKEESVTVIKMLAAVICLSGCFLAVGGYDAGVLKITPLALVSGAGSILCFAFLNVFTRRALGRYSMWTVALYAIGFASLFWQFLHPPWKVASADLPSGTWPALALLAVVSILIPNTLYFGGLRTVAPSRAIITSTFEPIVAIVTSALVLGEFLLFWQVVGAMMVIGAIVLLQTEQERPPLKAHAAGPGRSDARK